MKLIKPSFSIWEQEPGLQGIYKQIEKSAKVCYKSEGNITEDSAQPFIDNVLLKRHHYSPLEHGTIYLKIPTGLMAEVNQTYHKYLSNPYSKAICRYVPLDGYIYVTTNYRALVENSWLDDLQYICEPTEFHEKRITVKFILSRSIAQEYTRHRVFSFAMESQRYCNYSTDKFSNEVTFINPCWIEDNQDTYDRWCFYESLNKAEEVYFRLLKHGWKPQQAREVLPNACKTELIMTGFVSQWKDFFMLRSNKYGKGGAHPSADELATPLYEEFVARGYIK